MNNINYVAWWGAVLSTVVFGWDIIKWATKGARVIVTTQCNITYIDSRVISSETTEHGTRQTLAQYCHVEILNRGDAATTIISIEASHNHKKHKPKIGFSGQLFVSHSGTNFPLRLAAGEMWSGRVEMLNFEALIKQGRTYISVRTSHRTKPIRAYLKI